MDGSTMYAYFRTDKVVGSDFRIELIEQPAASLLNALSPLGGDFGKQLLSEGRISMRRIDDAVRRILRVKFRAGLFENPYAQFTPAESEAQMLKPDAVAAARKAAGRSTTSCSRGRPALARPRSRT